MSTTPANENTTPPDALASDDQTTGMAHFRKLPPEEIAALDIDQVARDNSAALEALMNRK